MEDHRLSRFDRENGIEAAIEIAPVDGAPGGKNFMLRHDGLFLRYLVRAIVTDIEQIATREQCSVRHVNMTISPAFVAAVLSQVSVPMVNGVLPPP